MDESGDIIETTLSESGELVSEEITGNVTELPLAEGYEEYQNEEGQTVRPVQEASGNLLKLTLDEDNNLLDIEIASEEEQEEGSGEERSEEQESGEKEPEEQESEEEAEEEGGDLPQVTQAAAQKAQELGVDLSQIEEGSGAGGRVLVKDVMATAGR